MSRRSRRQFLQDSLAIVGLGLATGCGAAPFVAHQTPKLPAVGYIGLGNPPGVGPNPNYDAFVGGLRELGWVDGQTLTLHSRLTQGRTEPIPDLVGELIRLPVDMLVASGAVGAAVAAKVTTTLPIVFASAGRIVELAARYHLPAMFQTREFVGAGGLLAYGPSPADQHRRAATYVDKVLRGAKPADLPVEQPTKFDFLINLKTAQALGLAIPPSVLQQATEIIQ